MSEPGLVVRPVREDEHASVGALVVAAYTLDGFLDPGSGYVEHLRDTATRARQAEVLVAVDAETSALLGTVTWCPAGSPWREIARDDEGEFRMLAVAPPARGRGVGEALVAACLELARTEGRAGVALCSMPEMSAARRLYARLGFTRAPEQDWRPADDDVLLEALRLRF